MEKYIEAVKIILLAQKQVIGPVAVRLANSVEGLKVDTGSENVSIDGDPKETIEKLVNVFASLFGDASVTLSVEEINKSNLGFSSEELPKVFQDSVIK